MAERGRNFPGPVAGDLHSRDLEHFGRRDRVGGGSWLVHSHEVATADAAFNAARRSIDAVAAILRVLNVDVESPDIDALRLVGVHVQCPANLEIERLLRRDRAPGIA